jgi:hypothetical protein
VIAATALAIDYAIQLTVMQPGLLKGETEGLSPLSQYNPHGIFIALENIGYAVTGLAFLFLGVVFDGQSRLERMIRSVFIGGGALTLATLIALSVRYGADLDYRFEIYGLLIDWLVLIVSGVLLSLLFKGGAIRRWNDPGRGGKRHGFGAAWMKFTRPVIRLIAGRR